MSGKPSQRERILDWFRRGYDITSYDAYTRFGITQLGAIIFYLKKDGFQIGTEWIERNGSRFKRYFLEPS